MTVLTPEMIANWRAGRDAVVVQSGPRRGRPSHDDPGHDERMRAHIERASRECPELRGKEERGAGVLSSLEAGWRLGISAMRVGELIRAGTLKARRSDKNGRTHEIEAAEVERLAAEWVQVSDAC